MFYNSCSELLVSTSTEDPQEAYDRLKVFEEKYDWNFEPGLTVDTLKEIKKEGERIELGVYDSKGDNASVWFLQGKGFCFEGGDCCYDSFPILDTAIKELSSKIEGYDGGSVYSFEEWSGEQL